MKKMYIAMFFVFITIVIYPADVTENEFVQQKKQSKRVSLDTLKKDNVESCSRAFDASIGLVEKVARVQKCLKKCIDEVVCEDTRTYHEKAKQQLSKALDILHSIDALLADCEQCLTVL